MQTRKTTRPRPWRRLLFVLGLVPAAACGSPAVAPVVAGRPGEEQTAACAAILRAAPPRPGRPTTVVLAVGDGHAPAVETVAGQGGNLVVARATSSAAVAEVAAVDLEPRKDTPIEREKAASVRRCVASSIAAPTGSLAEPAAAPVGDPVAGLGWATARAAGVAQGQPARVVVLGAGSGVLSGIDLTRADLSTVALREEAARKVADAYPSALRPVPGVDVLLVQPGEPAANGLSGENRSAFYDLLGQRTMHWTILPALPASFVAKAA